MNDKPYFHAAEKGDLIIVPTIHKEIGRVRAKGANTIDVAWGDYTCIFLLDGKETVMAVEQAAFYCDEQGNKLMERPVKKAEGPLTVEMLRAAYKPNGYYVCDNQIVAALNEQLAKVMPKGMQIKVKANRVGNKWFADNTTSLIGENIIDAILIVPEEE